MSAWQHPCSGCKYFHGDYLYNRCCNYIFITGRRRPCPAGEKCRVKTPLKKGERSLFGVKAPSVKESEERT